MKVYKANLLMFQFQFHLKDLSNSGMSPLCYEILKLNLNDNTILVTQSEE